MPPLAFFVLPLNLLFLTYVLSKARLVEFNVALARFLLYSVALLVVAALTFLFVGGLTLVAPGFMGQGQVLFTVCLVMTIALVLVITLPRFFPVAERIVQERISGGRLVYQDMLANLVKELSRASSIDQMLETVATTIHSNMQVTRVLIFLQDPLTDEFRLQSQSGLNPEALSDGMTLTARSPSVRWLREHKDALVQDEVARTQPPSVWGELAKEFNHFGVTLYVPMLLDERLVGVIAFGEKQNREMFYASDLRLLGTLATEVALGVRYRRLEEQAVHQNKLISLGTIAAGIAHEIRNPLASIRTFAQLLPTNSDDPEFKNSFGKMVIQDADRITRVIQSMLSFARPGTVNVADHGASEIVDEALTLIQSRLKGKNIAVTKLSHERPILRVDKQQIIQVLLNLLNNAIDALPTEGQICITTGVHHVEGTKGQSGQRFGVIEIADNGPGIPVAVRSRLFDPFFTTKKDGTGLGLSISQKIVRDHNGLVTVSSIEGRGTSFQVHLPLA
jgi:signal transduction histidine kinase